MVKRWKKVATVAVAIVMASSMALGFTACDKADKPYEIEKKARTGWKDEKVYSLNDYTGQMPDVWNDILTSDATNTAVAGYLNSAFYEFDYKFDASGNIVPGEYTMQYSAATKLEDVTSRYLGKYGIDEADVEEGRHAFAITLRNDLKWDDGTPIKAADFVYTMSQQLSPNYLFQTASNYYSGNYIIHNASNYVKQGQSSYFDNAAVGLTFSDLTEKDGTYTLAGNDCYIALKSKLEWLQGNTLDTYVNAYGDEYFGVEAYKDLLALADDKGNVKVTTTSLPLLTEVITAVAAWGETEAEVTNYMYVYYAYPEMDFSEVGYFVGENEYELVLVIDNTLNPLDKDGNLTYEAGYYLSTFPLVKKDVWEKCEDTSTKPWKNTYCSGGVENSASWGPYKMTNYQSGVTYTLSRNENWYGYGMDQYEDQFQTDNMVTRYIPEWNTAWQIFQQGEIDSIGMDVTIQGDYRNSRQAYFTPETYTFDLNIQSNPQTRTADRNNLMLKYDAFRQAISLAINRDDYCAKNSPSSQAALSYLNQMYYYDVENGGVYSETKQAKEVILTAYGATKTDKGWKVGETEYTDVFEAADAITGYNLTLARELMTKAYNEAVAAGDYKDGEKIILLYGAEKQTSSSDRVLNWFRDAFNEAVKGTPFEGMIEIEYFFFSSATWSKQFMNGEYDLCFGAWGNAPFNPYYLFGETQINKANRYALGWDPDTVELTLTLNGDGTEKCPKYENLTLNLNEWNDSLQGKSDAPYNFSNYPNEDKLNVLSAEEAAVLQAYWSIPVYSRYSASLMGYKCDYISYEYNTFMAYGGVQYMSYNFDDTEWAEFVKDHDNLLNYKFGRDE